MRRRIGLTITGSVQGVGFRFETKNRARTLGISGFVQNNADGSVYLEAEGEDENLERFLYWCRKGPEYAEIRDIRIEEKEAKNLQGFVVRD